MPKYPKGILGVRKDPKNQVLFSFKVREGEEWPSSDSDSDYVPDDDLGEGPSTGSGNRNERSKRKRTKKSGSELKKRKINTAMASSGVAVPLPTEIWLKIFQYVVLSEGALPFLLRAKKVCKLWEEISSHGSLWHTVDLAYGWITLTDQRFKWLCANRLTECTDLNLSQCKIVSSVAAIANLTTYCKNLRTLNLSRCKKLQGEAVMKIATCCPHLENLDLSATTSEAVSPQALLCVAEKCGRNLRSLNLAHNALRSFGSVFTALMEKCPNLESLDLCNVVVTASHITIDIELFQKSCPKMKTLRLVDTPFRLSTASAQKQAESEGFPDLREASLASNPTDSSSHILPEVVNRVLKNANKLQMLDLRGCRNSQVFHSLTDLAAENLSQLYISRSAVASYDDLHVLLGKWRHSLVDLDLSWNQFRPTDVLIDGLKALVDDGDSKLEILNLAGTPVTMEMLEETIPSLPFLRDLDLTSCRDMTRGCKRQYKTAEEIRQLMP